MRSTLGSRIGGGFRVPDTFILDGSIAVVDGHVPRGVGLSIKRGEEKEERDDGEEGRQGVLNTHCQMKRMKSKLVELFQTSRTKKKQLSCSRG